MFVRPALTCAGAGVDGRCDAEGGCCFQLCLTRFRGGPIGGICWVARALNASAIRCGWVCIIDFHPTVSITSVA